MTKSPIAPTSGLYVHAGIAAGSPEWHCRWQEADVFVFPSTMETFGIVLLEALAFMVPVVSSRAGAAVDILEEGRSGWLLDGHHEPGLKAALDSALEDSADKRSRVERGRDRFEARFALPRNAERLAGLLKDSTAKRAPR